MGGGDSRKALFFLSPEDDAAAQAEPAIGRVDHAELPGGDSLDGLFGLDDMQAVFAGIEKAFGEFRRMADFETDGETYHST